MSKLVVLSLTLGTFLPVATATGQNLDAGKLVPLDGTEAQGFGTSTSASGDLVCIGVTGDSDVGVGAGAAYLFSRSSGAQLRKIYAPDPDPGDLFGSGVSVASNRILLGAGGDDDNGRNAGAAYLGDALSGGPLVKFYASDASDGDNFGARVALSNDYAVVGAPGRSADVGGLGGAAYLFSTATGAELAKLLPSDHGPSMQFGFSVAINADHVLIGAPKTAGSAPNFGAAYLFSASTGMELQKLVPNDPLTAKAFGWSVALSDEYAVVGAQGDDEHGIYAGAAYVFSLATGQQTAKLLPDDVVPYDNFGWSVAIDGDKIFVVAVSDEVNGYGTGSAYTFSASSGQLLSKSITSECESFDSLGVSVAASDGMGFIPGYEGGGTEPYHGVVHMFDLTTTVSNGDAFCFGDGSGNACPCTDAPQAGEGCRNSRGRGARLAAFGEASLSNDTLRFSVAEIPGGTPGTGSGILIRGGTQVASGLGNAVGDGLLCVTGSVQRSQVFDFASGGIIYDFRGQPLGSTNGPIGQPVNYQYWFREPANFCSGEGFNFTNAWTLTWLP